MESEKPSKYIRACAESVELDCLREYNDDEVSVRFSRHARLFGKVEAMIEKIDELYEEIEKLKNK